MNKYIVITTFFDHEGKITVYEYHSNAYSKEQAMAASDNTAFITEFAAKEISQRVYADGDPLTCSEEEYSDIMVVVKRWKRNGYCGE